jgi:ATP-dependent DNA helicase RecG
VAAQADGFRLAEIDLELRNQGELNGTRQSGAVFRVARLPGDEELLDAARRHAATTLERDPDLTSEENALLGWCDVGTGATDERACA